MVITVYKGKKMVEYLKRKYPQKWKEAGKPTPGYMPDVRRQYWSRFIMNRKYLQFDDPELEEMGESQHLLETVTLGYIIGFAVVFGGIAIWARFAG